MEDCETPVEGALAIKEAALGVVFCSTGLLINGRTVAGGVELFPSLPLNGAIVGLLSELRSGDDGRVEALGGEAGFAEAGGGGGGFVVRGEGVLAFDVSGEEETEVAKVFGLESSWEKGDTVNVLVGLTGGAED